PRRSCGNMSGWYSVPLFVVTRVTGVAPCDAAGGVGVELGERLGGAAGGRGGGGAHGPGLPGGWVGGCAAGLGCWAGRRAGDGEPGGRRVTGVRLGRFHCSIGGAGMPPLFGDGPPAQMSLAEVRAAPDRVLNTAVEGLGLGTTAQLVPFHCSIRVPLPLSPTAHTSLLDTAATPLSPAPGPAPLGLATMLQAVPFQCSVRGG